MGAIIIEGIEGWGHHGTLPEERERGQRFLADVRLDVDTGPAAASDDLSDTIDYSKLARGIHGILEGEPVNLLEAVVDRILDLVMADSRVREAEVRVCKPEPPLSVPVDGVCVERRRRQR